MLLEQNGSPKDDDASKVISWTGSSKNVTYNPSTGLAFEFTDRVSVFDRGPVPVLFPGLGALRRDIASYLFRQLRYAGFPTHYKSEFGDTSMSVVAYDIPEKEVAFVGAQGRLLPLEILFRWVVTQKFFERIERGEVSRIEVGRRLERLGPIEVGSRFKIPFIECSTKHEAADRYLSDAGAASEARITIVELHSIYGDAEKLAAFLQKLFHRTGFDLATGKFEGAILYGKPIGPRSFILCDSLTPDELQLVGLHDGQSYDKDPLRFWYADNYPEWVSELNAAKKRSVDKSTWPKYPAPPPPEVVNETIRRYQAVDAGLKMI